MKCPTCQFEIPGGLTCRVECDVDGWVEKAEAVYGDHCSHNQPIISLVTNIAP